MSPDELLDRFLTSKSAAGCTPHTLRWYRMCIEPYLRCLDEVEEYKRPETIEWYMASLRSRNLAPSTVSGHYTALSAWFKWATRRRYLSHNPMLDLTKPKKFRPVKNRVPREEFARIYRAVHVSKWIDQRDKCLLLVLYYSGLRMTECLSLTPTDIDFDEGLIAVRHGKGDKARIVPCHPLLLVEIVTYLEMRPAFAGEHLFVACDGHGRSRGQLTVGGLRSILMHRSANAGVKYRSAHAYRHSFAIEFLNSGMEMSAVAAALGHASVKTTEAEYAYWLTAGIQREYNEALQRMVEPLTR